MIRVIGWGEDLGANSLYSATDQLRNLVMSVCSGGFDDNSPLSSVERFDPRVNHWEYVAELTTPRGGVGVATVMGRVFAVGGHNGNIYLNTVEAFEPRTNR